MLPLKIVYNKTEENKIMSYVEEVLAKVKKKNEYCKYNRKKLVQSERMNE